MVFVIDLTMLFQWRNDTVYELKRMKELVVA
jgi:hypothetical protein